MTFYHVELHRLGGGLSGGEKCLLEVTKSLMKRGIANVLVVTDNARETYERLGLRENEFLTYCTVPTTGKTRCHTFIEFALRVRPALRAVDTLSPQADDVLVCNSAFFPNAMAFRRLAQRGPEATLLYWYRMMIPALSRGFKGHYTGRHSFPSPSLLYYHLDRAFYRHSAFPRGIVLTYNPAYVSKLERLFPRNEVKLLGSYSGSERSCAPRPPEQSEYDVVWMGRFQEFKGILDVVPICERLVERFPDIRVAVIGGGDSGTHLETKFARLCRERGLSDNIHQLGYIVSEERFRVIEKSKLFLMTSYYESFGNVIIEAMSMGLPVVAYDLPTYEVFEKGMHRVSIGDTNGAGDAIGALLADQTQLSEFSWEAYQYAQTFTWDSVGVEILDTAISSGTGGGSMGRREKR